MFTRKDGSISLTPTNESETRLFNYFKSKNKWHHNRRFNDFKINDDGTTTLFLKDGYKTDISTDRLHEVQATGNVSSAKAKNGRYAQLGFNGKPIRIHRFLCRKELEQYEGFFEETGMFIEVNHIDENPLNNTDENLEVVTAKENILKSYLNRSKGYFERESGKFQVQFQKKHVGTFDDEVKAAVKYHHLVVSEIERLERIRFDWLNGQKQRQEANEKEYA